MMTDGFLARRQFEAMYPILYQLLGYVSGNAHDYGDDPVGRTIREWVAEGQTETMQEAIQQLNAAIKHLPIAVEELSRLTNTVLESEQDAREMLVALRDGLQSGVDALLKAQADRGR